MLININSICSFINNISKCPFCYADLHKELDQIGWEEKPSYKAPLINDLFTLEFSKKSFEYSVKSIISINSQNNEVDIKIIERSSTPSLDVRIIQEEFNYSDFFLVNSCLNCDKQYSTVYHPLQISLTVTNQYKTLEPYFLIENMVVDKYFVQNDYAGGISSIYREGSSDSIKTELLDFSDPKLINRIYNIITFS